MYQYQYQYGVSIRTIFAASAGKSISGRGRNNGLARIIGSTTKYSNNGVSPRSSFRFCDKRQLTSSSSHVASQQQPLQHPKNKWIQNSSLFFLEQIKETCRQVVQAYPKSVAIAELDPLRREELVVARRLEAVLRQFLQDGKCPRCWLKEAFCICAKCPPLEPQPQSSNIDSNLELSAASQLHDKINRIFVIMHHQEVCLSVDTAKMILAALPNTCRLVVSGIGPEYQASMKEMMQAMGCMEEETMCSDFHHPRKCLILFPTSDSKTFAEIVSNNNAQSSMGKSKDTDNQTREKWDIILLDGTWSQARKLYYRYLSFESNNNNNVALHRVKLKSADIEQIESQSTQISIGSKNEATNRKGLQLRKHPILWREISTLEALRLLLRDVLTYGNQDVHETRSDTNDNDNPRAASTVPLIWEALAHYQDIANSAVTKQKGR